MKRKTGLLSLIAALVLLFSAGCAAGGEQEGLLLYYAPSVVEGGSALVGVPCGLTAEDATAETLLAALLAGPEGEGAARTIPRDVELLSAQLDGSCLTVDLSERYGGLTDVSLTLADYAITLTLCQLPGVESVRITVEGRPVQGGPLRELRPEDLLQSGAPAEG